MTTFKRFLTLFLIATLSAFTMHVWGADKTVSWSASSGALGTAIASVGGTATGTINTTNGADSYSWSYTRTLVSVKSGKSDYVSFSSPDLQLGSSNAGETLNFTTSNIPGTIKSVTVGCWSKNGNHTLSITVGGTSYYSGATPSATGQTKSGSGTSTGTISIDFSISGNNALYISSITVVYDNGGGASCGTDPTVGSIMNAVSGVTSSGATFTTSAGVSAGTDCSLTEVGFVYNTSGTPTISDTKAVIDGYTSGTLSKSVTGLSASTTYYVRAFATNEHGTSYSDQKTFTTEALTGDNFELVTDVDDLNDGDEIILLNIAGDAAMGPQSGNNCPEVASGISTWSISGDVVTVVSGVQIITLGISNSHWTFDTDSGYLYAASSGSNHLKVQDTNDANGEWTISLNASSEATITAQGSNTRNLLRYNSGSSIFSCYGSGQQLVKIYKKASDCTPPGIALSITNAATAFVGTPLNLTSTGGNGGIVVWSVTNGTGSATITGSTLTPTSAGTVTVKASQAKHVDGLTTYCATSKTQVITISEAPVTVRFFNNGTLLDAKTLVIASGSSLGASLPTLTTGDACDATSNKFAGWTKQEIEDPAATIDLSQFVGPDTEISENLDLNALWASENATPSTFDASSTSNITESSTYYEWSENTTGAIFGGGYTASDAGSYFQFSKGSGELYIYVKAPTNTLVSKYVLTINGATGTYGIGTPEYGTLTTSGSTQTIANIYASGNVYADAASSSNSYIRVNRADIYNYVNYLTHCSRVKQPVISPESGTYYRSGTQEITMTSATDGASIYYTLTTDGSTPADPTSSSTLYSAAIPFSTFSAGQTVKIKAIAIKGGMSDSRITSVEYVIYEGKCQRPTFTPGNGTYTSPQSVVINSTADATIYYTTDGTDPSSSGTRLVYSSAITVDYGETTLKAYAEKSGYVPSDVATALYTVEHPYMITYHVPAGYAAPTAEFVASTTLPTGIVEPCDEWRFVGWSTTNIASKTETATVLSGEYHPTSDVDLYAVYAAEETTAGAAKYNKVTAALTDYSGDYLIVYESGAVAFNGGLSTLDATSNTISVSISDGTINATSTTDAAKFTITKATGGYSILSASGNYINRTASSNGMNTTSSATYNSISMDGSNAVITSSGGPTLRYNKTAGQTRFRYFASGQEAIQLYKRASGVTKTYYMSSPTCTPCTEAAFSLTQNSVLLKSDESTTITVTTNNTSDITIEIGDLDIAEAEIAGNVITITAINDGTTELTIRQNRDKSDPDHPICAVTKVVPITVKDALIDVVEVGTDYITIEHDYGGGTSITMQEQLVTLDGDPAEDIFFSKYYEAASNMKLFAIYNGTEDPIDLSKIRIRSVDNTDVSKWANGNGKLNYIELGTINRLKKDHKNFKLEPFTEIVFWSNNKGGTDPTAQQYINNKALRECISMEIKVNGVTTTFTYDDLAHDRVPNWYCLGDSVTYSNLDSDGNNQFIFNGDDALIMERDSTDWGKSDWYPIDLIGAGTKAGPNNGACVKNTSPTYSIGGYSQALNDEPGGWYTAVDGEGNAFAIPYSTNRYLLTRKKSVKSGADAVKLNTTDFVTLKSEWNGIAVGGSNSNVCYSGTQFSVVGQYDYANYYSEFRTLDPSEATATPQSDGTVKVTIPDLVDRACDYLNIQVKDGGDIAAEMKYKVPIIVQSAKATTDDIFYNEGEKGCKRCDVVVLNGATLTKAADGTTHDMPVVRDMEVYAGGQLIIPAGANYNYTMRSLTIRSNEDNVGSARIDGTIVTDNIYHDKRMKGGSAGRWYWMCLPYACNIKDVHFRSGEAAIYGTDWWLQVYDGQERVNTASGAQNGWKMVNTGELKQLQPGVGYIVAVATKDGHTFGELRFPMAGYQESASKYVPVDDYGAGVSVTPNHKGWNLVGNPFMDYYLKGNLAGQGLTLGRMVLNSEGTAWEIETPATVPYITLPVDGGYSEYTQVTAGSMDLPPFISYFVQIAGSDPDTDESDLKVAFDPEHRGKSPVRRRFAEADENDPIWVAVALRNSGNETDETTLVISDNYTDEYEIGGDLYKWRGAYYKYAQITTKPVLASRNATGEMAFNAIPDNTAKAGVPLNYFAATNGEYTFSLKRNYSLDYIENVLLVDMQEGTTIDLLDNDYTFDSNRGDYTSRFKLIVNVNRTPKIMTGFEHIGYSDAPRKLLINGHVYIQRGNRIYDITGKQAVLQ